MIEITRTDSKQPGVSRAGGAAGDGQKAAGYSVTENYGQYAGGKAYSLRSAGRDKPCPYGYF